MAAGPDPPPTPGGTPAAGRRAGPPSAPGRPWRPHRPPADRAPGGGGDRGRNSRPGSRAAGAGLCRATGRRWRRAAGPPPCRWGPPGGSSARGPPPGRRRSSRPPCWFCPCPVPLPAAPARGGPRPEPPAAGARPAWFGVPPAWLAPWAGTSGSWTLGLPPAALRRGWSGPGPPDG